MPQFSKLELTSLSASQIAALKNLTTPNTTHFLQEKDILAYAAFKKNQPIGLALCKILPFKSIEIVSFFISIPYRNKGIGSQFLPYIEDQLAQENFSQILTTYEEEAESSPYFIKILKKDCWAEPVLHLLQCFFYEDLKGEWLNYTPKYPKGFKEFPLIKLTSEEKKQLKYQERQWVFPHQISPLNDDYPIDQITSFGLRYEDQIIGWLLTQRIAEDTIKYTALYINPLYKSKGIAIRLLVNSIKRQVKNKITWGIFDVNPKQVDDRWMKFVYKRLVPYTHHTVHIKKSWKSLQK